MKTGFGTDLLGAMHEDQLTEFEIRARVLPSIEILRQATSLNAELLGRPGEIGAVAPGALADLIAVDGDPVADVGVLSGQGERITLVMKRRPDLQAARAEEGLSGGPPTKARTRCGIAPSSADMR